MKVDTTNCMLLYKINQFIWSQVTDPLYIRIFVAGHRSPCLHPKIFWSQPLSAASCCLKMPFFSWCVQIFWSGHRVTMPSKCPNHSMGHRSHPSTNWLILYSTRVKHFALDSILLITSVFHLKLTYPGSLGSSFHLSSNLHLLGSLFCLVSANWMGR